MNVIGIGTDIVECSRIESMIAKHDALFLKRVYTDWEISYCSRRKASVEHFAGRWAAKEATIKALHAKIADVPLTDITVTAGDHGEPQLHLSGIAAAMADDYALTSWSVSLTHDGGFAAAMVIGVAES